MKMFVGFNCWVRNAPSSIINKIGGKVNRNEYLTQFRLTEHKIVKLEN